MECDRDKTDDYWAGDKTDKLISLPALELTACGFAVSVSRRVWPSNSFKLTFTGANYETFRVTFSAGVVEYSRNCTKLQELYVAADAALYQAKAMGRNRVLVSGQVGLDSVSLNGTRC
ncbi:diguanylate cyclase [Planktothrix agardhii 1806]|jgi:hypothetical protein|uniref:diguanylate cyclase domain-containing protein n=2 Tax=Planktothrix agardhii TaxID=1160 RepID=UPI0005AACE4A|nr:diguanylate cyclase [Planktothrix agardhii]MCB8760289.1 diguanylate cyclase [Planktothrix agardhii 1813]MCB8763922.1 diguanylate cyclase [Planktothrix agardhii 1809]MCB8751444.1 diguanylate cyclase [Planktothrix agardhii 1810]MCB8751887.1 diguanylate cyclase [Planktothrix agardhii 1810]MCB8777554.1 diguanylate cyclase [Planktothrix agardhii 1031]